MTKTQKAKIARKSAAKKITREEWLNRVAKRMVPWFKKLGYDVPAVRVSVGFTSAGMRGKAIGECWSNQCSEDGVFEIFIHPQLDDETRVAGVVAHEMVHAVVGLECGHKGAFRKVATAIGLEGKMTATTEGDEFKEAFAKIEKAVGPFPHSSLTPVSKKKKQTTRMIKCECQECGYVARTSSKWIDEIGAPHCPEHGEMEVA